MRNTFAIGLIFLALPLLFTNCSKDDEEDSLVIEAEEISAHTWVIDEIISHQNLSVSLMGTEMKIDTTIDALEGIPECEYDVDYNFLASGVMQYTLSETYCGAEVNGNFTWELNDERSKMTIVGDEGALFIQTSAGTLTSDEVILDVLELNGNVLKLKYEIPLEMMLNLYMDPDLAALYEDLGFDYEVSGSGEAIYTFVAK